MITTEHAGGWTPEREEKLRRLWLEEGKSGTEIALLLGGGLTRNGVIGKVHRMRLTKRELPARSWIKPQASKRKPDPKVPRTKDQVAEDARVRSTMMARNRNAGQPKAAAIRHHIEMGFESIELPAEDGVDVTRLMGITQLTDATCRFPQGDPLKPHFGFCGHPTKPGSVYCPEHHARCYVGG